MSLWKKPDKPDSPAAEKGSATNQPLIERVTPPAAYPAGKSPSWAGDSLETVAAGPKCGWRSAREPSPQFSHPACGARPEGVSSGDVTVDTGVAVSAPASVAVGVTSPITCTLSPILPSITAGNTFTTFSGSRGQKVPVSVFKIDRNRPFAPSSMNLVNPTGLAFDRTGYLYISSRMEGTIYKVSPEGHRGRFTRKAWSRHRDCLRRDENCTWATGRARVFKISRDGSFLSLRPSSPAWRRIIWLLALTATSTLLAPPFPASTTCFASPQPVKSLRSTAGWGAHRDWPSTLRKPLRGASLAVSGGLCASRPRLGWEPCCVR